MSLSLAIEWKNGFGNEPTVTIDQELFAVLKTFPGHNLVLRDRELDIVIHVKEVIKLDNQAEMN